LYNRIWSCERDSYAKKTNSGLIEPKSDSLLNVYDISNGLFSNLDILHINQSTINKTDIFITTKQGFVYKYNGQFEEIYKFPNTANQYPVCDEISKNSYWILNGRDLLKIKNQKLIKSFKIPNEKDNLNRIINKTPNLIIESRDPLNNVSYWELKNDELIPFKFKYLEDETYHIFKITRNFIYFSKDNIILVLNKLGKIVFSYKNQEILDSNFKYQTAFTDKQNILWISTRNGIVKLVTKKIHLPYTKKIKVLEEFIKTKTTYL
tara:strand:+ start:43645 stop:44436 length:792 start_codon:yes stop_codon:yes gene_type:complete